MKKKTFLPDFHKLCKPEQTPIADTVSLFVFFFFAASLAGYLWEVLIFFFKEDAFRNRGFLYGPWLPVYGIGAVGFSLLLSFRQKKKRHPLAIFLYTALLGTGLELVIGWLLDTVWHLRYWDYSSCFLQYHGYVCLWSAIGFGIAGVLWICLFSVLLEKFWFSLPRSFRMAFNTLCSLFFCVDCAAALIFPNIGRGITF